MALSCAEYLLPIALACLAAQASGYAETADHEHFLGRYACEATPHWVEFEIIRSDDGFAAQDTDGSKFLDLKGVDGVLTSEDHGGKSFSIRHDPAKRTYTLSGMTEAATFRGMRDVRFELVMVKALPMRGKALEEQFDVTAVSLVRKVRQSEQWMHEFDSLHFVADVTWTRTPAGIEYSRQEIKATNPDADLSRERFYGLVPRQEGKEEFCFDRRRFRVSESYTEKSEQVQIWDGQAYTAYTKYYTHDQEQYYIAPDLGSRGGDLFAGLAWLRSRRHDFWWHGDVKDEPAHDDSFGRAEDFVLMGKQDYRAVPCYVLECRPRDFGRVRRWFVGVEDGLLRGNLVFEQGQLSWEYWTDQYQQVRPGWWFPTVQGYHVFDRTTMVPTEAENGSGDDVLRYFVSARRDICVTSVEVNQPLADELFRMEFKEGVQVADLRFGGIVTYRYKKNMTDKEWEEIRQEALRRAERDSVQKRALDARIGLEAPAFPAACNWLNTKPLTWQDLRGKAVVLQFWSRGCGPCHNYIRSFKAPRDDSNIILIGIHVPDDDLDAVKEILAKYDADGPVCVDAPPDSPAQGWGLLSSWFTVKAIPFWCVVGPDGKVAGHSMQPGEAFQVAHKTLSQP